MIDFLKPYTQKKTFIKLATDFKICYGKVNTKKVSEEFMLNRNRNNNKMDLFFEVRNGFAIEYQ